MRAIGTVGTLGTAKDDEIPRDVGTVRAIGTVGTLGIAKDDGTLEM